MQGNEGFLRAGYFKYIKRRLSERELENSRLLLEIKEIYSKSKGTYGSPRVWAELVARGRRVNRKRVQRLIKVNGIQARIRRKFRITTDSKKTREGIPDLVNRNFQSDEVNKIWVSDITYVPTREGWLYLCAILDVFSRNIVGWAMSNRLKEHLGIAAMKQAVKQRRPEAGLIFHSDRGSQYDSDRVRNYIKRHNFRQSMGSPKAAVTTMRSWKRSLEH